MQKKKHQTASLKGPEDLVCYKLTSAVKNLFKCHLKFLPASWHFQNTSDKTDFHTPWSTFWESVWPVLVGSKEAGVYAQSTVKVISGQTCWKMGQLHEGRNKTAASMSSSVKQKAMPLCPDQHFLLQSCVVCVVSTAKSKHRWTLGSWWPILNATLSPADRLQRHYIH